MSKNIIEHKFKIGRKERNAACKHPSFLIWFTGLSGSGKSTIANLVEERLFETGIRTYVLDGDNIRKGLNKDLGFSEEDRYENIRRIAEVSKLMIDAGLVVLAAFVSPFKENRDLVSEIVGKENYYEVFVNTSLEECERRDVKGLYKKARAGEITDMTGIDSPYEKPLNPDVQIDENDSFDTAVDKIIETIENRIKNL